MDAAVNLRVGWSRGWRLAPRSPTQFLAEPAPIRASRVMIGDQGPTRVIRLPLWPLTMRPNVLTAVAAPTEAKQVHLENASSWKAPGGPKFGC